MAETNEWSTAPKDGSEINIQFPDGTKARAKWDSESGQWKVPSGGKWLNMEYVHGNSDPVVWWP